jgi:hypothetical protein
MGGNIRVDRIHTDSRRSSFAGHCMRASAYAANVPSVTAPTVESMATVALVARYWPNERDRKASA